MAVNLKRCILVLTIIDIGFTEKGVTRFIFPHHKFSPMKTLFFTTAFIFSTLFLTAQTPREVFEEEMSLDDPNFYEVVNAVSQAFENLPNGMEEYEEDDEEFCEFYPQWRFFWQNKIIPNGSNSGSMLPYVEALSNGTIDFTSCTPFNTTKEWEIIGPQVDPEAGSCGVFGTDGRLQNHSFISQIWADKGDHDHIIVAIPNTGLWETENRGGSWTNISKGADGNSPLLMFQTNHFAVKPDDTDVIYVSVELGGIAGIGGSIGSYFIGIYYTTDGGITWQEDESFPLPSNNYPLLTSSEKVSLMQFGPYDGNDRYLYVLGYNHAFRKDLDATTNPWIEMESLEASTGERFNYSSIAFDPDYPNRIYMGRMGGDATNYYGQIFYHYNYGSDGSSGTDNWEPIGNFNDPSNYHNAKVYIPDDESREIFIYVGEYTDFANYDLSWNYWIYKGDLDEAPNIQWGNSIGDGFEPNPTAVKLTGMKFTVSNSKLTGSNNRIIYFPMVRLMYSGDGGTTTDYAFNSEVNEPFGLGTICNKHADIRDMFLMESASSLDNAKGDILYLATDGGVTIFENGTCDINSQTIEANDCFENINGFGLMGQSITDMDIVPESNNYMTYSAWHHNMTERVNGEWFNYGGGDTYNSEAFSISDETKILWSGGIGNGQSNLSWGTSSSYSGLTISNDHYLGDPDFANLYIERKAIQVHPNGNIYLAGHDLMKTPIAASLNFVPVCTTASTSIGSYDHVFNQSYPHDATGQPNFPYQTASEIIGNGPTWGPARIATFNVNESDDQTIYVGFVGSVGNVNLGVIKSSDGGETWNYLLDNINITNLNTPLGDGTGEADLSTYPITSIVSNPDNPDDVWLSFGGFPVDEDGEEYTSNLNRVLHSIDGGENWVDVSNSYAQYRLLPVAINQLLILSDNPEYIFAATGNGVFVGHAFDDQDATEVKWYCLNDELPPVNIVDLEIDECRMQLYAAASNWGIWSLDISEFFPAVDLEDDIVIDNTNPAYDNLIPGVEWSSMVIPAEGNIRVKDGYILKITDGTIVDMPRTGEIIVEAGAKLVVDDATLTSGCSWQGVILEGDPLEGQYEVNGDYLQGIIELKNGAVIENANDGIITGYDWNTAGGIIWADEATFRNNKRDVAFWKYQNYENDPNTQMSYFRNNRSSFMDCTFTVDNELRTGKNPKQRVTMWDVDGVTFTGCTFKNENPYRNKFTWDDVGIYAIDANFIVSGTGNIHVACPSQNPTCHPNTFDGFFCGIWASSGGKSHNFKVDGNEFDDCVFGIISAGTWFPVITRNTFSLGNAFSHEISTPFGVGTFDQITGVHISKGSGYRVEENVFNLDENADPDFFTNGTWVDRTGGDANQIYKNTFNDIHYSELATGLNRSTQTGSFIGLQYLCNDHVDCKYDIAVRADDDQYDDEGISDYQGNPISGLMISAGNLFSNTCLDFPNPHNDFRNDATNQISYVRDVGDTRETPICKLNVQYVNNQGENNSCQSNFDEGGLGLGNLDETKKQELIDDFKVVDTLYRQNRALYLSYLDGGSTENLTEEIMSAFPSETWELREKLLDESPFLSQEVLIETAWQTDVFPEPVVFEILAANPEALQDGSVLDKISDYELMQEALIDQLREIADSVVTYRTVLEATLAQEGNGRNTLVNYLITDILSSMDDTIEIDHDSLRFWLDLLYTPNADYQMIEDYISINEWQDAQMILESLPNKYRLSETEAAEYESYLDLFEILSVLKGDDRNYFEMDSTEKAALEEIAEDGYGIAKVRAENILRMVYNEPYLHFAPIPLDDPEPRLINPKKVVKIQEPKVLFHPNPADDNIQCDYELVTQNPNVKLIVADVMGRVVFERELLEIQGAFVIDTREWLTGIYFYSVTDQQKFLDSGRFLIMR